MTLPELSEISLIWESALLANSTYKNILNITKKTYQNHYSLITNHYLANKEKTGDFLLITNCYKESFLINYYQRKNILYP